MIIHRIMSTIPNQVLINYLNGLRKDLQIALLSELNGNNSPTLKQIQQAMEKIRTQLPSDQQGRAEREASMDITSEHPSQEEVQEAIRSWMQNPLNRI